MRNQILYFENIIPKTQNVLFQVLLRHLEVFCFATRRPESFESFGKEILDKRLGEYLCWYSDGKRYTIDNLITVATNKFQ